jgi:hypothetical protein
LSVKKPIVQLLENYVLAAVGELPTEEQVKTKVMMTRAFGAAAGDDWQNRLREEFGVTDSLDEQLRTMWSQAKKLAAEQNADLPPRDFATMVVEENFTDAVEMIAAEAAKKYED